MQMTNQNTAASSSSSGGSEFWLRQRPQSCRHPKQKLRSRCDVQDYAVSTSYTYVDCGIAPEAASVEELVQCCIGQRLPVSHGEDSVVLGAQLSPPFFKEGFQLGVDVRGQNHGGPFPVGLASLVVTGPMANDPPALLIAEQGLSNLQLSYGALPARQEHHLSKREI